MNNLSKELVEMQILLRKYKVPQRSIDKIINREKSMQKDKDRLVSEREDLLSSCLYQDEIIDKAIEYINKFEYQRYCPSPYEKEKYIMREEKEGQELLEILRGVDNETN